MIILKLHILINTYNHFPDKPGVVKNLTVGEITESTVALSWELPDDNGGSDITGYVIERRDISKTSWAKVRVFYFSTIHVLCLYRMQ